MRKSREFKIDSKHLEYMNQVKEDLLAAQNKIKEIKGSREYQNAQHYFTLLKHRGIISEAPSFQNGYQVELVQAVTLDEIKDILTPEQMQLIASIAKKRSK